VISRS
jgi:hypothetical protein